MKIQKEEEKFAPSGILEGMTSIRALLKARADGTNDRRIEKILYDSAKEKSKAKELAYLRHRGDEQGFEVLPVPCIELDAMTVGSTHGGIIALCSDRTIPQLTPDDIKPNGFYVMLEGIEDPYNFGYSLRSLYASGACGIIMPPRNWMTAAGVVCRASAGASELFKLYVCEPSEAAEMFKSKGYSVICADKSNKSVSVFDADLILPLFLVVGGEKRGISRPVLDLADEIVELEYGRDFPAALSAASAATIFGYEIFRRNKDKIKCL